MAVVGQLTGGRLYDRIHYCLYLNNTHSGGVSLQQTKEKIKNQRGAGKVIPLHSKFTEPANDVSRDSEVLYGQKGKEVRRA